MAVKDVFFVLSWVLLARNPIERWVVVYLKIVAFSLYSNTLCSENALFFCHGGWVEPCENHKFRPS